MQICPIEDIASARAIMADIGVTARGSEIMAEKALFLPIRVSDVDTRAANILKQTMLSQGGDVAVSAGTINLAQPYTDVLILATAAQLKKALPRLQEQPWGLKKLAGELAQLLDAVLEN